MPDDPGTPRLLSKRPPEIDTLVDDWLLRLPKERGRSLRERFLPDLVHFSLSLGSEIACLVGATPGWLGEMSREGAYPKRMRFRKLPYRPEMADLTVLRETNPDWIFREDFDPKRWVFVFLHGYVDNTGADRVAFKLASLGYQVYLVRYPFLQGIGHLADELVAVVEQIAALEPNKRLVPIGHSLGGCIWDHALLHDHSLVERFSMPLYIPMGSPHFGTFAAYLGIGQSARDMVPNSDLVNDHLSRSFPPGLEIYPFVSRFDLLVLPIETALLKRGVNYIMSETGHIAQVIRNTVVTAIEEIIASPPELLKERAERRPFYPSLITEGLTRLPKAMQRALGVDGVLEYIHGDGGEKPEFYVRVLRHELGLGIFPALQRP